MAKTSYDLSDWLNYLTHDEIDFLKKIARLLPEAPVIVNIGAGAGTSGLTLREARFDANLWTIDIRADGPLGGLKGERDAFKDADLIPPYQVMGDSKDIGKNKWVIPVDMLFVDGDHEEAGIRGDIDAWLPHVKDGGYVAFHDYGSNDWPAVKEVVDEEMKHYKMIDQVGSVRVFQK